MVQSSSKVTVEFDARGLKLLERIAKALEESNKLRKGEKVDQVINVYTSPEEPV